MSEPLSFSLTEPETEEPGMLMTSMIDVIFILLAFFVVVSETKKGRLQVDVPEVEGAQISTGEAPPASVTVEITAKDEIYFEGQRAADDASLRALIKRRLQSLGAAPGKVPVHVAGDRLARHGTTLRVIGALSQAGFRKFQYAVETGGN